MAIPLRGIKPKIADVQCSRLKLEPGDRVIVRVYQWLDKDQYAKLRKGVQKWAGPDVEILIINATKMEITVDKQDKSKLITPM